MDFEIHLSLLILNYNYFAQQLLLIFFQKGFEYFQKMGQYLKVVFLNLVLHLFGMFQKFLFFCSLY